MNVTLRSLSPADRPALRRLLSRIEEFSPDDQSLAMELVEIALDQPDQKEYDFFIAASGGDEVAGFVCYGPTPLTEGTFDLYWIAVDPDFAGNGIGSLLLKTTEDAVTGRQGRLMLIETSSNPAYENTRRFYLKNGYRLAETIQDFYRDGEDRVTYVKRLHS